MKTLKTLLSAMRYNGHVSLRRIDFHGEVQYIAGGTADSLISRYGGYKVEKITCIDNVLIIYVN